MKKRFQLAIASATMLTLAFAVPAFAFHDGGVAECSGCHSMHSTTLGATATANAKLLKGSDDSSTCLNCHAGNGRYHVDSTDGSNVNAGGDFYWVKVDYTYDNGHGTSTSSAAAHGHNIVAADYGFVADATNTVAPGGTYPAADLGCTSCHNPHGQVNGGTAAGTAPISGSGSYGAPAPTDGSILGNYRLLGDTSYQAPGANAKFTAGAPIARADNYDGAEVDYGKGMSEWCANCHGGFYKDSIGNTMHPAGNDVKLGAYVANYNSYVKTGDFTGTAATSYDALVPFERGQADSTQLFDSATNGAISGTAGPDTNSNVMCLTCHRAHASAFDDMTRWDMGATFLAESGAVEATTTFSDGSTSTGKAAYYRDGAIVDIATTYGQYQRSLCNKCHVKD